MYSSRGSNDQREEMNLGTSRTQQQLLDVGEEERLGACVGLDGGGAVAPGALGWSAGEGAPDRGEGAFDRGGEGRPEGIGLSIGAAQATGGEGAGDVDDGGAWRRGGATEEDDGVLAEGRSDGGRRRPVRFQIGGWGRGSLVISLVFTWSENPLQRQLFRNGGSN